MTPAVANAVQRARYVIWRKTMTEPQVDDPTARGENDECEDCGCFIYECTCSEPDEMYGEMHED